MFKIIFQLKNMDPQQAFKYCPRCKSELRLSNNKKLTCANCGWVSYINAVPCNAVLIVNNKNEVLLVERKTDPFTGYWDMPGGFVELNETIEDSVRREVKEELGVEVSDLKYFMSTYDRYLFKGLNDFTLGLTFIAKIQPGAKITVGDDAQSYKYFGKEAIPWDRVAFKSIKTVLETYFAV